MDFELKIKSVPYSNEVLCGWAKKWYNRWTIDLSCADVNHPDVDKLRQEIITGFYSYNDVKMTLMTRTLHSAFNPVPMTAVQTIPKVSVAVTTKIPLHDTDKRGIMVNVPASVEFKQTADRKIVVCDNGMGPKIVITSETEEKKSDSVLALAARAVAGSCKIVDDVVVVNPMTLDTPNGTYDERMATFAQHTTQLFEGVQHALTQIKSVIPKKKGDEVLQGEKLSEKIYKAMIDHPAKLIFCDTVLRRLPALEKTKLVNGGIEFIQENARVFDGKKEQDRRLYKPVGVRPLAFHKCNIPDFQAFQYSYVQDKHRKIRGKNAEGASGVSTDYIFGLGTSKSHLQILRYGNDLLGVKGNYRLVLIGGEGGLEYKVARLIARILHTGESVIEVCYLASDRAPSTDDDYLTVINRMPTVPYTVRNGEEVQGCPTYYFKGHHIRVSFQDTVANKVDRLTTFKQQRSGWSAKLVDAMERYNEQIPHMNELYYVDAIVLNSELDCHKPGVLSCVLHEGLALVGSKEVAWADTWLERNAQYQTQGPNVLRWNVIDQSIQLANHVKSSYHMLGMTYTSTVSQVIGGFYFKSLVYVTDGMKESDASMTAELFASIDTSQVDMELMQNIAAQIMPDREGPDEQYEREEPLFVQPREPDNHHEQVGFGVAAVEF